jgi:UDP-GlcNAc:undecaprenyl-phosphate/decaprenyl-phosphate GlcNAc-1-phosphate transferase
MLTVLLSAIVAFILSYATIPVVIRISKTKNLYDEPDSVRKLHKIPIPSLGGIAIFIGYISAILCFIKFSEFPEFQTYLFCFLIIFFVGIQDDLLNISPVKKLIAQIFVSAILIFKTHLVINLHEFLGFNYADTIISYCFTFLSILVIINSFNLIDGVDGLAGTLGFITTAAFGILFYLNGNIPYAILGFGFAASILGFLTYNFPPAKIFMGDTGSLLLGVISSILLLKFNQNIKTNTFSIVSAPAIAFSLILLPVFDTMRVFAIRIFKGLSPLKADRNHIHHLLLDKGFSHKKVTLSCAFCTIVFVICTIFFKDFGIILTILVQASIFSLITFIISRNNKTINVLPVSKKKVLKAKDIKIEKEVEISNVRFLVTDMVEEQA